jgi:hypothetical protein
MNNYNGNHYRTYFIVKECPALETFKFIFDSYFEYNINDYLEFYNYEKNVINLVNKRLINLDHKSEYYKKNPLNINACYSYFKILKIKDINNKYLFYIYKEYQNKQKTNFILPPNQLIKCKLCQNHTYIFKCHLCNI